MTKTITIIDSNVANYESIVANLDTNTEWFLLGSNTDGVLQIQAILSNYKGLDAIHIISHGNAGSLSLGSTTLSSENISNYSTELQNIGKVLSITGDILLYGCNVAQGDIGTDFIATLSKITQADVAASANLTGSTTLGGDLILESATGNIESAQISLADYQTALLVNNTAPTFKIPGNGTATTYLGIDESTAKNIAVLANGKIIVGGISKDYHDTNIGFSIARYNSDGSLDASFGTAGTTITNLANKAYGEDMAVDSNGRPIVVGFTRNASSQNYDIILTRYTSEGLVDNTFSGDGTATFDSGVDDLAYAVTTQSDSKILVGGYSTSINGSYSTIIRYNQDGTVDTSFGDAGIAKTVYPSVAVINDIAVKPDGKIIASGKLSDTSGITGSFITRYNTDGSLDSSFGSAGTVVTTNPISQGISILDNGKIVVAGFIKNGVNYDAFDFSIMRYNADGSVDTSFGTNGNVITSFSASADYAESIAIQTDGKILVAGYSYDLDTGRYDFAIARYNTDGTLDSTFSSDGKVTTNITGADFAYGIALQADGKIILTGNTKSSNPLSTVVSYALARYNTDGSLDTTFGAYSTLTDSPNIARYYEDFPYNSVIDINGNAAIFDSELAALNGGLGNYSGAALTLQRSGGANPEDVFGTDYFSGTARFTNGRAFVNNIDIGAVSNANGVLSINFNSQATQANVNSLLRSLAYSNTSDTPPAKVKIDWIFNDGNTGAQGTGGALSVMDSTFVEIAAFNDAPRLVGQKSTLPSAYGDSTYTLTNTQLTQGFIDPEGASVSALYLNPSAGSFALNADGNYTYIPNDLIMGIINLNYHVSDGTAITATSNSFTYLSSQLYTSLLTPNSLFNQFSSLSSSTAMNSLVSYFDNLGYLEVSAFGTYTSTKVTGTLTNGDSFSVIGTNLLGYPSVITKLDYFSASNIQLSTVGNVSQASEFSDVVGSLSSIVLKDNNYGLGHEITYTLNGNFDVNGVVDTINNIQISQDGNSIYLAGNLISDDLAPSGISGTINTVTLHLGTFHQTYNNVGLDFATFDTYTNLTDFLAYIYRNNDLLNGTSSADLIFGFNGNDTINGLDNNDSIAGGNGHDTINGGTGDDVIEGNNGNDVIDGGIGSDIMRGGDGADVYVIDNINDQVIETSKLLATGSENANGVAGNSWSQNASISANGQYIAFVSNASNLATGSENAPAPVNTNYGALLVKDLSTGAISSYFNQKFMFDGGPDGRGQVRISSDGKLVVFASDATDIVANDTNALSDIFVYNLSTATISKISTNSLGEASTITSNFLGTGSFNPRFINNNSVLFESSADNLVANDTNQATDVFIKDLTTGATKRISLETNGTQLAGSNADVSADGALVVFQVNHVYLKNTITNQLTIVDTNINGVPGYYFSPESNISYSYNPSISGDGKYVVFETLNRGLVEGDTTREFFIKDVLIKNVTTGQIEVISKNQAGQYANANSYVAPAESITKDGKFVVFSSEATNLVPNATGGYKVFVKNMLTNEIKYIGQGTNAKISDDGITITFNSLIPNVQVTLATNPFLEHGLVSPSDTVQSSISYLLPNGVENLTLTGSSDSHGLGNKLNNLLTGNSGNNSFTGYEGYDTMNGGAGEDIADYSSAIYGINVDLSNQYASNDGFNFSDQLVDIEGVIGGAQNDFIKGNDLKNSLFGGLGIDTLIGGLGDDTYWVNTQQDQVIESVAAGIDTIISSSSLYLYNNTENLTLENGKGDIFGVGNEGNNIIYGNDGRNLIIGKDGNDFIAGQDNNDVLYGQNGMDTLIGGNGIDTLIAGEANDYLDGGNNPDALYGENGDDLLFGGEGFFTDILVGGNGNDTLDGSASYASNAQRNLGDYDYLYGQNGNDTYYVDNPFDYTFEGVNQGTDYVYANITGAGYYLYANVEFLILMGNMPFGVGNELNNSLIGNTISNYLLGGSGNDTINGKQGNDVLFGESGADVFIFERGTGGDVIGDFVAGTDKIQISSSIYSSFAQVQANMVQNNGTTAINLGQGDLIVINGVPNASLSSADFIFS